MPEQMIPLADLGRQHEALRQELDAAVARVLDRCDFVRGAALQEFERRFADYLGVDFVFGVGSGTDAISLALMAAGVGDGDEVVTAANTFAATAEAIIMAGATPVFCDVDHETLCMDPASLRQVITAKTRAVIPVHLHGHMAQMEAIGELAADQVLKVVEDAAQAHGSEAGGRRAGTVGEAGCFSFFPSKNLGACGDGGAVATSSEGLASKLAMLRDHGRDRGRHLLVGQCSRLDTLQAAILGVKLPHLDAWNRRRREVAARYYLELDGVEGLRLPCSHQGAVYHHYAVRTARRDELRQHLAERHIASGVHYGKSVPQEPAYTSLRTIETPVADLSCLQVLSLPLFPEISDPEVDRVAEAVRGFFGR